MIESSTHILLPAGSESEASKVEGHAQPRKVTIEIIRQFARCYIPGPITAGTVVILN